jgi:1-acyl-sn-glycerol-3-phosphate acyltransferase
LILAGNHVAVVESALMAIYSPRQVEFLGTGDIPIDPSFAWLTDLYQFIPILRGSVDRQAMNMARDVLRQGGALGIFPEGGIWDPDSMPVRLGVAWLSREAQAPVLPVGFGGLRGAVKNMVAFKRPRLTMNVGSLIPALPKTAPGGDQRGEMEAYSRQVIGAIQALIPEAERRSQPRRVEERYALELSAVQGGGEKEPLDDLSVAEGAAFAQFLFNPVLVDVFYRNLHMPVGVLRDLRNPVDPAELAVACRLILDYLPSNPGFFTYRLGMQTGIEMQSALATLAAVGQRCAAEGHSLELLVRRSYRREQNGPQIVETLGMGAPSQSATEPG